MPRCLPSRVSSPVTCRHSSRVGTRTSTEGSPSPGTVRSTSGRPKAKVLPFSCASEVMAGKETEQTADLKRKLEQREQELKNREAKLSQREARLQQQQRPAAEQQKSAWLGGNSLVD